MHNFSYSFCNIISISLWVCFHLVLLSLIKTPFNLNLKLVRKPLSVFWLKLIMCLCSLPWMNFLIRFYNL
jgi:hypothetical protein